MKPFLKYLEARRGSTYKNTELLLCFSLEIEGWAKEIRVINVADHKKSGDSDASNIWYDH